MPESTGEKEATKKGYRIPSEGLAIVLKSYFDTCAKQLGFIDYFNMKSIWQQINIDH